MSDPITPKLISPLGYPSNANVAHEVLQPQPNPGVEDSQPVLAPEVVAPPTAHNTPNNLAWLHGQLKELRTSLEGVDGSDELRERISELARDIRSAVENANVSLSPRREGPGAEPFDPTLYQDKYYIQFKRDESQVVDKVYPLLTSNNGKALLPQAVDVVNKAASLVEKRLDDLNRPDSAAKKVLKIGARILYGVCEALGAGGAIVAREFGRAGLAVGLVFTFGLLTAGDQAHRAYHRSSEGMRKDLDAASRRVELLSSALAPFPLPGNFA
ncbi:MAG: hypothetical protein WDO56_30315 [Gammaproteobacteria bacterium]